MSELEVTVVLLNYNRENDLVECLHSLYDTEYPFKEIVVVDNGSQDQSVKRVKIEFPDATLLPLCENLGYTGGMNEGIKHALKKNPIYLLIINCDTTMEKTFVSLLVNAMEKNKNAAAATGTIYYYENKSKVWFAGGEISFWRGTGICRYDVPTKKKLGVGGARNVSFISGCGLLVRSDIMIRLGAFDNRLFMYYEDAELSVRLRRHGFDLIHVPSACMYHKVGVEGIKPYQIYYGTRNRLFFLRYVLSGFPKIVGFSYIFITWSIKMSFWFITNPPFFFEAKRGIKDFLKGIYYKAPNLILK